MLDELTWDCKTPRDVEKLYSQMLQHMINRSLEAEMQAHLRHERHGRSSGNVRNGKSRSGCRGRPAPADRDPARTERHVRAAAGAEAPGPAGGDGGGDPDPVRQRHDHARHRFGAGRSVRGDDLAQPDRAADRCGAGQGPGVAGTAAGGDLSDRVAGRNRGEGALFPKVLTQLCIVHLVCASLRYVSTKDSKSVVAALKRVYQSATAGEAALELGV